MGLQVYRVAAPERARLRTKGFCGASGEATTCGVNLYEDMVADCQQNEAVNHTGTVQNGQNLKHIVSTACKPGIALFKGFPNIPNIPPPPPPYGALSGNKRGNKGSNPLKRTKLADSAPMPRDMGGHAHVVTYRRLGKGCA